MPTDSDPRPYKLYRSGPRGLLGRLRGEDDVTAPDPGDPGDPGGPGDPGKPGSRWPWRRRGRRRAGGAPRPRIWWKLVLKWLAIAVAAWIVLSIVLFIISSEIESGSLPSSADAALSGGSNMITGTDTVLVIGTDQRPTGSTEPGANTHDSGSRSDTLMLWRIGGGTSRRLSIPRDTLVSIPGHGQNKINAAYAYGGPALTIKTVEALTGIKINHVIIVDLANFPQFIDAIGGVDVKTGRICSKISGGAKLGGFSLFLKPGTHHLTGIQALTLARTRENACNAASNDLTREGYQQKILNGIKGQLLSLGTFFRLPWASWDAPKALRTDMGPATLMGLFVASEIGGSAPVKILGPTAGVVSPTFGDVLEVTPAAVHAAVNKLMNG
jgi:LCP family protein required for cell wall assembly